MSFVEPEVRDRLEMPPEVYDPIIDGLTRVIRGPGVRYDFYHATTGQRLFKGYPVDIAGKTGTAQGAANLPWNDSSVFGAFGLGADVPFTVLAYLEKSGYGSKAAAPVTKCIFLALSGRIRIDPVYVSDPLDLNGNLPAPAMILGSRSCLVGSAGLSD
jgi:penicillin-binding protein 2